jgi:hypothetical protein
MSRIFSLVWSRKPRVPQRAEAVSGHDGTSPVRFFPASWNRIVSAGAVLAAAIALLAPCTVQATPYVVRLVQHGSNVVAIGSGEFDLTGLTRKGSFSLGNGVGPSEGYVGTGPEDSLLDGYSGPSGPTTFGSGRYVQATAGTGDAVALNPTIFIVPLVFVPLDYLSGTALANRSTWDNASFASLGITPGTYTWTWGAAADQSFTLEAFTSVPEPAELGMFGFGLLLVGGFLKLRHRQAGGA